MLTTGGYRWLGATEPGGRWIGAVQPLYPTSTVTRQPLLLLLGVS